MISFGNGVGLTQRLILGALIGTTKKNNSVKTKCTKMSDTPRTEAAKVDKGGMTFIWVEFAEQLERELTDKTNEVARLREQLTRVLLIAETFRFYTRDSEWRDMKNELDKIKAEIK